MLFSNGFHQVQMGKQFRLICNGIFPPVNIKVGVLIVRNQCFLKLFLLELEVGSFLSVSGLNKMV